MLIIRRTDVCFLIFNILTDNMNKEIWQIVRAEVIIISKKQSSIKQTISGGLYDRSGDEEGGS